MTAVLKIQKLLALTESSNDHEALNALRRVQQILSQKSITLANYVQSNQPHSHDHSEIKRELRTAESEAFYWKTECQRLSQEITLLRRFTPVAPKKKSASQSKLAKAKLDKLKTRISDLEGDNEMFGETISELEKEIIDLRRKIFSSARGDSETTMQSFIDKNCIFGSRTSWFGTTELHNIFKKLFPKSEMSVSLFSRVFSHLTGCRPSKGGPRKQIMGFCVSMRR